jgi:hypothetical protein
MPGTSDEPRKCYFCHRLESEAGLERNGTDEWSRPTWRCTDKTSCISWREQRRVRLAAATAEFATSDLRAVVDRRAAEEKAVRDTIRRRQLEVDRANLDHEYAARLGITVRELREKADIYEDYLEERRELC